MCHDKSNLIPFNKIDRAFRRNLKAENNPTSEMGKVVPKSIQNNFHPSLPTTQLRIANMLITVDKFEHK